METIRKTCPICSESLPLEMFSKGSGAHGRYAYCKSCSTNKERLRREAEGYREKRREYYRKNAKRLAEIERRRMARMPAQTKAEIMRRHLLKRKYGITPHDYDRMVAEQNGLCAICSRPPADGRRLAVDHCHRENFVRGLLCSPCNTALGLFAEDAERMRAAIAYLHRSLAGRNVDGLSPGSPSTPAAEGA